MVLFLVLTKWKSNTLINLNETNINAWIAQITTGKYFYKGAKNVIFLQAFQFRLMYSLALVRQSDLFYLLSFTHQCISVKKKIFFIRNFCLKRRDILSYHQIIIEIIMIFWRPSGIKTILHIIKHDTSFEIDFFRQQQSRVEKLHFPLLLGK